MNLHNYKKASDHAVQKWLEGAIVEMTAYQKEKLRDKETVRFAPFEFMEKRKRVNSVWLRLTIVFMPFVWILLFIGLFPNFLINGRWGYEYEKIKWFDKWRCAVGI